MSLSKKIIIFSSLFFLNSDGEYRTFNEEEYVLQQRVRFKNVRVVSSPKVPIVEYHSLSAPKATESELVQKEIGFLRNIRETLEFDGLSSDWYSKAALDLLQYCQSLDEDTSLFLKSQSLRYTFLELFLSEKRLLAPLDSIDHFPEEYAFKCSDEAKDENWDDDDMLSSFKRSCSTLELAVSVRTSCADVVSRYVSCSLYPKESVAYVYAQLILARSNDEVLSSLSTCVYDKEYIAGMLEPLVEGDQTLEFRRSALLNKDPEEK